MSESRHGVVPYVFNYCLIAIDMRLIVGATVRSVLMASAFLAFAISVSLNGRVDLAVLTLTFWSAAAL